MKLRGKRASVMAGTMVGLILSTTLFGLASTPQSVQAGATLPPRPSVSPIPQREDEKDDDQAEPVGAYLEVQVQPAQSALWGKVQWQNSSGGWQDVAGWSGALNDGYRRWWVAAKDFNTGPFRWEVRQSQHGPVVGTSTLFNLPDEANKIIRIEIMVE